MDRNSELIEKIVIDNFSEYFQTTAKIRPKPYLKNRINLPKKYQNSDYEFRKITYYGKEIEALVRKSDGMMVPSNSKTVDRPRIKKINGQDIYNQNAMTFGRSKIVTMLHDYFKKHVNIEPINDIEKYPLTVEMLFYVHDMNKNNIDNDNKWIWTKCFQDTLTEKGVIPDDNVYVISRNITETILIPEDATQQLIINIYG